MVRILCLNGPTTNDYGSILHTFLFHIFLVSQFLIFCFISLIKLRVIVLKSEFLTDWGDAIIIS